MGWSYELFKFSKGVHQVRNWPCVEAFKVPYTETPLILSGLKVEAMAKGQAMNNITLDNISHRSCLTRKTSTPSCFS